MSRRGYIGGATRNTMDLAAFRLDEVEPVRPGVWRYRLGARAWLDALLGRGRRPFGISRSDAPCVPQTNTPERPSNRA
jgi:hypothetical protein